jgi:hypothetical protein
MFDLSSVVLVRGSNPKPFGTGFVIHNDEIATYVLTCTHVVKDIDNLRVNDQPAVVVASDEARFGFDLAVLRVEGKLNCPSLDLNPVAKPGRSFMAAGFSDQAGQYVVQQFRGTLGKPAGLKSQKYGDCGGWQLDIGSDGRFEDGYSGSPVIDEATGRVLGVIAIRMDETSGKRGIAIAVAALRDLWSSMPASVRNALTASSPVGLTEPKDPVMNLTAEVAAFRAVLSRQYGQKNPAIVIKGGSGMGKSYLLQLYRQTAESGGFDIEDFGLAAQISVQGCLSTIVRRFGSDHFNRYEEYLDSTPVPSDPGGNTNWQGTLTRHFFKDLAEHDYMAPLVIFFDQYEKADQVFTAWLRGIFLPSITPRTPLIVVVAGQGADPFSTGCHFFELNGLKKEHFYRYAEECKVAISADEIDKLHGAWKGRPKEFAEYVKYISLSAAGNS